MWSFSSSTELFAGMSDIVPFEIPLGAMVVWGICRAAEAVVTTQSCLP